jgi:hypothetical protein
MTRGLLPYLILANLSMKKNTLIEHKETIVVCEEGGCISLNYNVLLTTLKVNTIAKHVVHLVITKSSLTCTKWGETCHTLETCHNMK